MLICKKIGIDSCVIPIVFHHNSGGNVNKGYMDSLSKVVRKHKSRIQTDSYHNIKCEYSELSEEFLQPDLLFKKILET